jgi:endonuclease/exonuclease/phosphatase family metal-dependent hydrolase
MSGRRPLTLVFALMMGAMLPASTKADPAGSSLRVVTFNLFHGGPTSGLWGDDRALERRLQIAIAGLRELRPDVVALQEASVSLGRGNVAARVAQALGYHHVFAPATTRVFREPIFGWLVSWAMNFTAGSAVLSRFPIAGSRPYDLPRCERFLDPRIALRAEIETPWGPLSVLSTHTSRDACQIRRLAELAHAVRGPLPTLVSGDLNHTETSAPIVALRETGMIDVFRAANPDEPGLTVWQRVEAPEPTVFRRVDYILLVPGTQFRGRVLGSRVVLNQPERRDDGSALWPSDHYGVLADIHLSP